MKYIFTVIFLFLFFPSAIAQTVFKTTANERATVELVIYNQNFALVREIRQLLLPIGEYDLQVEDIPAKIEPESVVINSLSSQFFKVIFLNYHYDLMSPENLLEKYIGKQIKVYFENPYTGQKELVDAELLSINEKIICAIGGEVYIPCPGQLILPQLPEDIFTQPILLCHISNSEEQEQQIEISYLTKGITWQADYILTLTEEEKGNLVGWATITNESGASYDEAQIMLIAGELHKIKARPMFYQMKVTETAEEETEQKPFFEYRLYALSQPIDLKNNQKKQVRFLNRKNISIKEKFIYHGSSYYYRSYYDQPIFKDKVHVFLETINDEEHNLGIPLPPGKIKVYQKDIEGNIVFIGEEQIKPTSLKEKIELNMGVAFDIAASRRQTVYRRLTSTTYEIGWEINLRNNKDRAVEITVLEEIPGDWKVTSASVAYQKVAAHTLQFIVTIPPDSETKLSYVVKVRD